MPTEKNNASAALLFAAARARVAQLFELVGQYNELRDALVEMGYFIPVSKQTEYWGQDWPMPELGITGNGCCYPDKDFLDAFWECGPIKTQKQLEFSARRLALAVERQRLGVASGWACFYCKGIGTTELGPDARCWHVDHAHPLANGGDDAPDNHVLACATCNLEKGVRSASEYFNKKMRGKA